MSRYEQRLEQDLGRVRESISDMAQNVEVGVQSAISGLLTGNHERAAATILGDHAINRAMRKIDRLCHSFIAQHLPSAGHLRLLSSVMRVNIELERIGDYAVTIARETLQRSGPPSGRLLRELERVGGETLVMLRQAIDAFNEVNADKARATMILEQQMEHDLDLVYADLMKNEGNESVENLVNTFSTFTQLKRVVDQSKNICEETVFAATGDMKAPKVYNILFVDKDNSCQSQMAVAIARKRYPGSGNYTSAGLAAAEELNPAMAAFLEGHGTSLEAATPQALNLTPLQLTQHHFVVCLQGDSKDYFEQLPFHTTPLHWDLAPAPADEAGFDDWLEEVYRDLATRIRDLMEQLRGEDAP